MGYDFGDVKLEPCTNLFVGKKRFDLIIRSFFFFKKKKKKLFGIIDNYQQIQKDIKYY